MTDEPVMEFGRNFGSDRCSACGKPIPFIDQRLGVQGPPGKPMLQICRSCVYDATELIAGLLHAGKPPAEAAEAPAEKKLPPKKQKGKS